MILVPTSGRSRCCFGCAQTEHRLDRVEDDRRKYEYLVVLGEGEVMLDVRVIERDGRILGSCPTDDG